MKKLIMSLIVAGITATSIFAQSAFDKDASGFHKKAVMVCGSMKVPSPDEKQVAAAIAAAASELDMLTQKYRNNPPSEYKNDPLWSGYFDDFADNLKLVTTFANQKDYRLVPKYCSTFCQIFGRMHRNNGTVDLTDMLFALNMQMKLANDMSNAGNAALAKENAAMIAKQLGQIENKVKSSQVTGIGSLFDPIDSKATDWIKAVNSSDPKTANTLYSSFSTEFPKLFMASM